jgi:hypothetical protein
MYIPFENALEQYMQSVDWPRRLTETERNHAAEVLARLLPVFDGSRDGGEPRMLGAAELAYARFIDGGRRLAYSDRRSSVSGLVTTRAALAGAIELVMPRRHHAAKTLPGLSTALHFKQAGASMGRRA